MKNKYHKNRLNGIHEAEPDTYFSICSIIRSEIRWRYNYMSNKLLKPKKASLCEFTQNYSNNINNCIELFKSIEWPDGFSYDHCGYHKY